MLFQISQATPGSGFIPFQVSIEPTSGLSLAGGRVKDFFLESLRAGSKSRVSLDCMLNWLCYLGLPALHSSFLPLIFGLENSHTLLEALPGRAVVSSATRTRNRSATGGTQSPSGFPGSCSLDPPPLQSVLSPTECKPFKYRRVVSV